MIRSRFRIAMLLPLFVGIAACGKVGDIEPRSAQSVPPVAYGATEAEGSEQLLTPSVQARPGRSDELLRRSEKREPDPFDLPPGTDPSSVPLKPADDDKSDKKPQPK